jgi:nucleoside-diphosphate-sugar epimerase
MLNEMANSNNIATGKGRLLITGAAGALGRVLRQALQNDVGPQKEWQHLRLSGRSPIGDLKDFEESMACDLANREAMEKLLVGVDAVVHLGGQAVESPFENICEANIKGVFNHYFVCLNVHRINIFKYSLCKNFFDELDGTQPASRRSLGLKRRFTLRSEL